MKRISLFIVSMLALVPTLAQAQRPAVPKIELSVGGGAGYSGYLISFDNSFATQHIANPEAFDLPKGFSWPGGHGGFYADFNFTEHWGLMTGLEVAFYNKQFDCDHLLDISPYIIDGKSNQKEIWVGIDRGFYESHRLMTLQIPVMGKFMASISRTKGHQYYLAAGAKLGVNVFASWYNEPFSGKYGVFAERPYPYDATGETHIESIITDVSVRKTVVEPDKTFHIPSVSEHWNKLKTNPFNLFLSLDTGFRWNLGHDLGLYTGLYCDFGLFRPIARAKGEKIFELDPSSIEETARGYEIDFNRNARSLLSILAADGPDICYEGAARTDPDEFRVNSTPYASSIRNLSFGIKLRFSFGIK